ncbi:MAG: InlB B-repeat-containing protein, partial [Bacilli bacterium]|nr:InlB B-repeat-containing protein [Bacilli bacterium]
SITKESTQDNITFVNASNGVACNDETSTGYNSLGYNTDYSCNKHYSGYTFTDTVMIDGKGYSWDENGVGSEVVGMPSHDGRSTMIGNTGNGYAKITLIEKIDTDNINYDLDGGTISKPKKSFSIFDEDFTLKTPTKEGYTFLGWIGGKNLYNSPTITKYTYSYSIPTHAYTGSGLEITTDTNSVKLLKKDDNSNWIGGLTNKIKLKKNTDYTLTMTIEGDASSSRIGVYNIENNEYVINQYIMNEMGNIEVHFTTDSTGYIVLLFGFGNTKTDKYFLFKNIQLEEGTEATSYEEYSNTRQKNLVITNGSQYNRTYKAVWRDDSVLCKKATTLNTRPCNALYEAGTKRCYAAGYEEGETITYGTLVDGDIKSGDAFDCDVNGDGIFDSENERFYYLTDLDSNNDYAVLLFSSYTKKGARHLTSANPIRYYTEDENWHGPITAIADLPSTEQWSNISLTNNSRQIYSENGNTTTSGGDLPIFAYTDKAARLPTYAEIFSACGQTSKIYQTCEYVLQDTSFDGMVTNGNFGFWLETPKEDTTDSAFRIDTHWMSVSASYPVTRNNMMVKPVIEVPKSKIK